MIAIPTPPPPCNVAVVHEEKWLAREEKTVTPYSLFYVKSAIVERCYTITFDHGQKYGTMVVSEGDSPAVLGRPCPSTIVDVWTVRDGKTVRIERLSKIIQHPSPDACGMLTAAPAKKSKGRLV